MTTPHRPPTRSLALGLGVLLLVAAATPLLPERTAASTAPAPLPAASGTAAPTPLTPAAQAEIERVVAAGGGTRLSPRASSSALARATTRCADFEGQRYCLGLGWTNQTQQQAAARMAAGTTRPGREQTGDLDPTAALRQRARMTPAARAAAERAELTAAAQAVGKVWLLRHEIQGVPLPAHFAQNHPEVSLPAGAAARDTAAEPAPAKTAADYPEVFSILKERQVRPQNRTYWCGPTAMQMIGWGWSGSRKGQAFWADQLGTTSAGTAITDIVRVVNDQTGWDDADHAGSYVALDVGDFTFDQWWLLMMKHVHDYTAPVVLHPVLLKQYYPYLDDDASGHFQVGRGFKQNTERGRPRIGYFEPWDQSRFDPSEPRIARTQWRSAYKSYRANLAHFQHNVGV